MMRRAWRNFTKIFSGDFTFLPEDEVLFSFTSQKDVKQWNVYCDAAFGGKSKGTLELSENGKTALFHGKCSKELQPDADIVRGGFIGINSLAYEDQLMDLGHFNALALHVRGDGHTYLSNIRQDNWTGSDEEAFQRPFETRSGEWMDVILPFRTYVFTWRGRTSIHHWELQPVRVASVGITMSATEDMPDEADFRLEIESIRGVHLPLLKEREEVWKFEQLQKSLKK